MTTKITTRKDYFADMPRRSIAGATTVRLSTAKNGVELYEDPNGDGGRRLAIVSNKLPAKAVEEIRQILLRELNNIK